MVLQRLSNDNMLSGPLSGESSASSMRTASSEGGEHLVEMRERLLSGDNSSGSGSGSGSDPIDETRNFDLFITNPTPPLLSGEMTEAKVGIDELLRQGGPSSLPYEAEESSQLSSTHVWDSVVMMYLSDKS